MDWKQACVSLWGEDWIAPLSEVLKVSRRTVERWKAGTHPIPALIEGDLVALVAELIVREPGTPYPAIYGEMMRRFSSGESQVEIVESLNLRSDALHDVVTDQSMGRFSALLEGIEVL